jgi:hypothetical protein
VKDVWKPSKPSKPSSNIEIITFLGTGTNQQTTQTQRKPSNAPASRRRVMHAVSIKPSSRVLPFPGRSAWKLIGQRRAAEGTQDWPACAP